MADARVVHARATRDYRLHLRFSDGLEGSVDCSRLLDIGSFKCWRDVEKFLRPQVEHDGRELRWWPVGLSLDSDILWHDIVQRGGPPRPPRERDRAFAAFMRRAIEEQQGPIGPLHRVLRGAGRSAAAKRAWALRRAKWGPRGRPA